MIRRIDIKSYITRLAGLIIFISCTSEAPLGVLGIRGNWTNHIRDNRQKIILGIKDKRNSFRDNEIKFWFHIYRALFLLFSLFRLFLPPLTTRVRLSVIIISQASSEPFCPHCRPRLFKRRIALSTG